MKSVMIIFNQAHSTAIQELLDRLAIRGFTKWVDVQGRGSHKGEPHYGNHAWPAKNMALLTIVDEAQVDSLAQELKIIDREAEQQGLRAFIWDAESLV